MRRRTFLAAALLASAWMLGVGPLAAQRPSAAEQSYLRTKARNYAEYKKTMELRANCSNNTVYADADGDIAYWHGNFIPRRDPRFDYTRPVDGGDPATNWRGLMTVDEAPHLLNPKSGYLFNVNDSPWNGAGASSLRKSDYPACVEQGIESARGLHAIRILAPDGAPRRDFSLDSLMRAAYDPYLPWFARTVPVLVSAYDAQPANSPLKSRLAREIALLRTWDDRWSADSVATSDRRTPLQTQMFLASVANSSNTAVTWGLSPAVGGISGSGVYTAPVAIATAQTVTATANSAADPTKKASAAIALTPGVSVSLTPTTAALGPSQTEAFLATVANSSNTSFTWSLSPAVGSISGSGVYTAPAAIATAQTVTATAPSAADSTKRASSRVTLASIPAPTSFPAPGAYTSTTSVTLSDGDSSAMIYYTTDGSTPSASSTRYTEAIPLSISATVRAIAINGSLNSAVTSGYYTISAPPAMVVTLTPTNAIIPVGLNQQFAAFVAGTQTTAVTWTLSGTGCSGKTCGTISSTGLYTAPAVAPSSSAVTITATSLSNAAQSASATVVILSAVGKTYYLAPAAQGGSDSNSGLTASLPWLTPNHAGLNCGDVIQAAASTAYVSSNFVVSTAPTCAAANNVVWIKCVAFDACKISITSGSGMMFGAPNWGLQGWEVDGTSTSGPCFLVYPFTSTTIHHLLFADNVANGCGGGGFSFNPSTQSSPTNYGTDYISVVGNIIYNSAGTIAYCAAGIEVYEPVAYDSLPGTHIYIAGNFSDNNVEPSVCSGGGPTDGEGVELDTFDGSQTGTPIYSQQAVIDNNIFLANGGPGIETANNSAGTGPFSHMYIRHNTAWGNNSDPKESTYGVLVGEIVIGSSFTAEAFDNIAATNAVVGAASNPIYSYWVTNGNGTDHVYHEFGYAVGGTVDGIYSSTGFSYGPDNLFGTNPSFANPVIPGAPNCSGYPSVPACMATVIADFTPTNAAALGYGYRIPSSTPVYDPLFPQWLCGVTNLPAGLVTPGCATAAASDSSTTGASTR